MKTHLEANLCWTKTILTAYQAFLRLTGKSDLTISSYSTDISKWLAYLNERGIKRTKLIRDRHIEDYLAIHEEKATTTIHRYFMSIKSFVLFMKRKDLCAPNLMAIVDTPKVKRKDIRVPTREEVEKILAMPNTETAAGTRDKAMMELMYSSGLRASEISNLRVCDVVGNSVHISNSKRGKSRTVPINESAKACIQSWLDNYRVRDSGKLFLTLQGKDLSRHYLGYIIKRYCSKLGLGYISPHTFRHACATHFLNEGADLRTIQEILGHSSISSTERYTHLSSKMLEDNFNKFSPRKGLCESDERLTEIVKAS